MAFKHAAGAGIIPTLSRLVLAAAFITVGYNKIFTEATFDAAAATTLTSLGVDVTPVGAEPPATDPTTDPTTDPATDPAATDPDPAEAGAPDDAGTFVEPAAGPFRLASIVTPPIQVPPPVENAAEQATEVLRQANENAQAAGEELAEGAEQAAGDAIDQAGDVVGDIVDGAQDAAGDLADGAAAAGDAVQDAAGDAIDAVGDAAGDAAEAITGDAAAAEPLPDGAYTARALHKITLMSEDNGLPMPAIMAWIAAITEFIGGIALLVGLMTRFWSMGLAIAMGTAFYMVSMNVYDVHTTNPFVYAEDLSRYTPTVAQLSLGILALGLVLTGAGPISLDRLVFPPDKVKEANANAAAAAGMGGGALVNAAAQGPSGQVISQPPGGPHDVPGVAIPPGGHAPYAQPAYAQPDPYAQPAAGGGLQAQPTQPAGYGQPNPAPAPSDVPLQGSGAGDAAPPADQMPPADDHGGGEPPRPRPETSFGGEGRPL